MSSEETTIQERLKGSLEELERLAQTQKNLFGALGHQYVVDVSGIKRTVTGISNLETRVWNLRRKANEFKETMYSISDTIESGEVTIPASEFVPSIDTNEASQQSIARELTRTCGAIALSLYSQVRSLFYQKMEDTLQSFDRQMEKWVDVSSSNVSSQMSMLSSKIKQMVNSEIGKILNNDYQVQILSDAVLNPENGQTMNGYVDSTMKTLEELQAACVDGKSEMEQTISDMFDQTLLALDDLNVWIKGKTLRTASSVAGADFAISCADELFMMNSRTTIDEDDTSSDVSSMKLAADFLMFSVDSVCQVVAFVSETTQKLLDFSITLGKQMMDSAKELSTQMIDASAVASSRFLYVVGGISTSDMAKDWIPGLLDFVGDTVPDEDFSKDVVGTADRIAHKMVDIGNSSAKEQMSVIGRRTSDMFENIHEAIKTIAGDTERVVERIAGNFLKGDSSFDDQQDYEETEPVLRMRAVGLQSREKYESVEWEESKKKMTTPWWKNQYEILKAQRNSFAEWSVDNTYLSGSEPSEPIYPDVDGYSDEEKEKALAEYKKQQEKYEKELKAYNETRNEAIKLGLGAEKDTIAMLDATLNAMEKAINSGDEEESRLAAKMFTELATYDKGGYFKDHFSINTDDENIVTGLQLCRNLGVWSYADDGSNLLKSFTADKTINHPFWQQLMKHEARGVDGIDKLILKAILSQDDADIKAAMKKILEKYGPGTRAGEYAMSLATEKGLFTEDDDPKYWLYDGLDDYWKTLGVTKDNPLQIHEILESDLFDEKVRDLYKKLQQTKDPEDLRKLFATMSQYIPNHSPLLQALKDNVKKKYGFNLDDYINDHFKEYTSEDWKKQLAEESARRKLESQALQSLISNPSDIYDPAAPLSDDSSVNSSSEDNLPLFFWRGSKLQYFSSGVKMLMHDGDQQVFNPYGHPTGKWTMYSFRPQDTLTNVQEENYPMIAITPSSFQSLKSINTMLNLIPFVVVREFFFKNQAGNIVNFIKGLSKGAQDLFKNVTGKSDDTTSANGGQTDESQNNASTQSQIKQAVTNFTQKIKEIFKSIDIKTATIDIPYILYCGLREKQWGNTYVFPYIVNSGTVINESSNESEWNGEGAGLLQWIKDATQNVANFIGGAASAITGSQAVPADLFPVPTWSNKSTEKISFSFSLVLINDHVIKARNNYMCVNTIIHNNRWMQKSILAYPGALYELWLPTGQRHLMCTGSFKLYPLGLNRFTPVDFFEGYDWDSKGGDKGLRGADFEIGTVVGLPGSELDSTGMSLKSKVRMPNPHISLMEVIPDAYKLDITFTSCLANNLNTAVFQYYVKMAAFNNYKGATEGDWTRNLEGNFSSLGEYGKTLLDVLAKRMQDPSTSVDFPTTNTGTDNGTLPDEVVNDGKTEQQGDNKTDDQKTEEEKPKEKHYVPLANKKNGYLGIDYLNKPGLLRKLNDRIMQYNNGDITADEFFNDGDALSQLSDDVKQKLSDHILNEDKKAENNPTFNETHNVPSLDKSYLENPKCEFGYLNPDQWIDLNDRINDYNRGEVKFNDFFSSISGMSGWAPSLKADILRYLMETDSETNKPKNQRHSVRLLDGEADGEKWFGKDLNWLALNIDLVQYNDGTKTFNQIVNEWKADGVDIEEKLRNYIIKKEQSGVTDTSVQEKKHNVEALTSDQFIREYGERTPNSTIEGNTLTKEQLADITANKTQIVVRLANRAVNLYNSGSTIDEAVSEVITTLKNRSDLAAIKDVGYSPERVESCIKAYLTKHVERVASVRGAGNGAAKRHRVYSRNQTSSETYIEKFQEATYNKKLQKYQTNIGDIPIDADSAVAEIKFAQQTIRETTKFLSKLYNAENNNLWWKPFEREKLYYTITPDARVVLRQRYGEKFISLKEIEVKIQNTTGTLDRINSELAKIPDLAERNPLLERKVVVTRELNKLEKQRDFLSDEIIQIDTDLIRDAFDEHDAVVSVKRRELTVGIFQQVWNEKIMNSYEREQMQYLTSDEKKRYFDDKIREMSKWDTHEILKKRDWFFRIVVMDFIVGEMRGLVQLFKECTYQDFETVYRIVRKLRLLRLDFDQAVGAEDFKINRTNLFRMTEKQVMDFTRLDKILTGSTLYELFLSQLELQFPKEEAQEQESSGSGSSKIDREIAQEQESEENLFNQRTVRQEVVARYWGSETELTKEAYDRVCRQLNDENEKITVYMGEDKNDVEIFNSIRELKNEIMRLKIAGDTTGRLQSLLGAFTSYVNLAKEAMVSEKMNEMRILANQEIKKEDDSVNAKVMDEITMDEVPFPQEYYKD